MSGELKILKEALIEENVIFAEIQEQIEIAEKIYGNSAFTKHVSISKSGRAMMKRDKESKLLNNRINMAQELSNTINELKVKLDSIRNSNKTKEVAKIQKTIAKYESKLKDFIKKNKLKKDKTGHVTSIMIAA
jgi:hypothetical protein